ncbi:MAG TPA: hypothetical protein VLZ75_05145 [Chitinophagales bacterium]|nr:hypothetical protein [Chitinophagales bacterium]
MKSGLRIILLISIGMILTSFVQKPVQDPYFVKMKGFKVLAFNTQRIELFSTAVFYNTYKYKAKLVEIDIDVYLENRLLGKVVHQENIPIPKLSAFDIPLLLKLEPPGPAITNSLWQSAKLITGKKVKIRYVGFIKLKIVGFIPIKVPIEDELMYSLY